MDICQTSFKKINNHNYGYHPKAKLNNKIWAHPYIKGKSLKFARGHILELSTCTKENYERLHKHILKYV